MTGEDVLAVLESIDGTLKALLALAHRRNKQAQQQAVASDRDLDGKYGDPVVKFMPRDWTGAPFTGRHFSECPPALLDMLAETFDYFARKADETHEMTNGGKPVAGYKRADAARARGWAKRIRSGAHVQTTRPEPGPTESEWQQEADPWQ